MQPCPLRSLHAWLCCLAALPLLSAHASPSSQQERDAKAPAVLPLTTWRELTDHPGRYTNKRLRLILQFQARVAAWNPYLTRFGMRDYGAYQFWGDDQRLWSLTDYQTAPVRLFARKHSVPELVLETARPYSRFEVEIVVREVFVDQPWAEIDSAVRLDEHVSEGTLIHASRATELMQNKSWKLAENELDQALIGPLPADAKRELEQLRDDCRQASAPKGRVDRKPPPLLRGKPVPHRPQE